MILRIVGSLFIIGSTMLGGFYFAHLDAFRISDLLEMKKALAILKQEVMFLHATLPEAFANISKHTNKPINTIFMRMEELMLERHPLEYIWETALSEKSQKTYFTKEDTEQFLSFGKTLGYLDKQMQLSSIELLKEYIDNTIEALNKTRYKNKKMFQSLGVLSGVLIVIILI